MNQKSRKNIIHACSKQRTISSNKTQTNKILESKLKPLQKKCKRS